MNKQEIFNFVSTHIFTQGKPAQIHPGGRCMYEAPDGKTCAVGCMIPVDLLPKFGKTIGSIEHLISDDIRDELPEFFRKEVNLLNRLQEIHDTYSWNSTDLMRKNLRCVAKDYNLDSSILETLSFGDR